MWIDMPHGEMKRNRISAFQRHSKGDGNANITTVVCKRASLNTVRQTKSGEATAAEV